MKMLPKKKIGNFWKKRKIKKAREGSRSRALREDGYTKGKKSDATYPFLFLASLQKKLFVAYLASIESVTRRDVVDAYMTSYFGAWLNHQGSSGPKKLVTGFTPRLSVEAENMQQFFEIDPDGKLISVVRDPRNWFPSAFRHGSGKYTDVQSAMSQ